MGESVGLLVGLGNGHNNSFLPEGVVDAEVDGGADNGRHLIRGDDEGPFEYLVVEARVTRRRCARGAAEGVTDLKVGNGGERAGRGERRGEVTVERARNGDGWREPGIQ